MKRRTAILIDTKMMAFAQFFKKKQENITELTRYVAELANILPKRLLDDYDVFFLHDVGKPWRANVYPEYKQNRIKKDLTQAEKLKRERFKEVYAKIPDYLRNFGNSIAIDGIEADDLASILSDINTLKGLTSRAYSDIVLFSSDSDWIKFVTGEHISILNTLKRTYVPYSDIEETYGIKPELKQHMDALCGVSKENIKGINRFGIKTFLKMLKENNGDLDAVIEKLGEKYDGSDKLPNGFHTVLDMYEFNLKLIKPMTEADLEPAQASLLEVLVKNKKENVTLESVALEAINVEDTFRFPSIEEQEFYKICR